MNIRGQSNGAAITLLIIILVLGVGAWWYYSSNSQVPTETATAEETAVRAVVTNFGKQLQMVSLSASSTAVVQAIAQYYAPYVAPELLQQWESEASSSATSTPSIPGRLTSSPWPDSINITAVTKNDDGTYTVEGTIMEITSVEATQGGVADSIPVAIILENRNGTWLITSFVHSSTE